METRNIMIVGVGGQGTLLASKLLGYLLCGEGFDVKVSEVHGMSQRGGSVVTYVRWGDCVASPIIDEGEADFVISFEKLEAARWAPRLREGGLIIVNDRETDPMPVITGAAEYPHGVLDSLRERGVRVDAVDALTLACQAGRLGQGGEPGAPGSSVPLFPGHSGGEMDGCHRGLRQAPCGGHDQGGLHFGSGERRGGAVIRRDGL